MDLAAEFGVQRPKAFAAAADMGFGDDDYIAHPFPLWFVKRSGARGAVMKAEYRDILAGMFESLAESSRSRMVDRRRRRPSMLVLQKELVEYRKKHDVHASKAAADARGAHPTEVGSSSSSSASSKGSVSEIQAAVDELEQALHEEIGDSDTMGIDRREFVDLAAEFASG